MEGGSLEQWHGYLLSHVSCDWVFTSGGRTKRYHVFACSNISLSEHGIVGSGSFSSSASGEGARPDTRTRERPDVSRTSEHASDMDVLGRAGICQG